MAQVTITQLPQAAPLTGLESVPIVQNGVTLQTTTGAIAAQPTQNQTFLTATQQPSLANSRALTAGPGLSLTDGGAQGNLQIDFAGAAASLNASPNGIQVKTGTSALTGREIAVGPGLQVANPDGVAGNPTVSLGPFLGNIQSLAPSTGFVYVENGIATTLPGGSVTQLVAGENITLDPPTGVGVVTIAATGGGSSLPDQTGNAGKYLTTDGTNPSWATIPTFLPITTNAGSTVDVNVAGGILPVLNNNGSTTNVSVS